MANNQSKTVTTGALQQWLPVLSISFAAFLFITTEMMPIGLLPQIAESLHHSEASTGLIVTIYAWCVALTSLPLILLTQRLDRRQLFFLLLGVFCVSHVVAGLASSFTMLMGARLGTALCHAVFWSIATPLAARLAPEGAQARALALMVGGVSLASVLGMPLGTVIGMQWGWRSAFWAVGVLGLMVWGVMARCLPPLPSDNTNNFSLLPGLLSNRQILVIYAATAFFVTGHFTVFSYLVPFFKNFGGYDENSVVFFLLLLGGSGALGGYLATKFSDKNPLTAILFCLTVVGVILVSIKSVSALWQGVVVLCMCWGAAMAAISLLLQMLILGQAKKTADMGIALYSSIFNVGIGGGAFIGSHIFTRYGIENIGYAGAVFFLGAIAFSVFLMRMRASSIEENA